VEIYIAHTQENLQCADAIMSGILFETQCRMVIRGRDTTDNDGKCIWRFCHCEQFGLCESTVRIRSNLRALKALKHPVLTSMNKTFSCR